MSKGINIVFVCLILLILLIPTYAILQTTSYKIGQEIILTGGDNTTKGVIIDYHAGIGGYPVYQIKYFDKMGVLRFVNLKSAYFTSAK